MILLVGFKLNEKGTKKWLLSFPNWLNIANNDIIVCRDSIIGLTSGAVVISVTLVTTVTVSA